MLGIIYYFYLMTLLCVNNIWSLKIYNSNYAIPVTQSSHPFSDAFLSVAQRIRILTLSTYDLEVEVKVICLQLLLTAQLYFLSLTLLKALVTSLVISSLQ